MRLLALFAFVFGPAEWFAGIGVSLTIFAGILWIVIKLTRIGTKIETLSADVRQANDHRSDCDQDRVRLDQKQREHGRLIEKNEQRITLIEGH